MTARARTTLGASLVEAVFALALGAAVLHLGLVALERVRASQSAIVRRIDVAGSSRLVGHVMRRELRHGVGGRDWRVADDSIPVRAFRGVALVCPEEAPTDEIVVSFRGDRLPDPEKDSVLLVRESGATSVLGLRGVTPRVEACAEGPGGSARWRLDGAAPPGVVLAKPFEHGSYHLSRGALRYRRGGSGRQPITPEVWAPRTGWTYSTGRVGVDLVPALEGAVRSRSGFLAPRTWDDDDGG